ncbi:MAG TPA: hypothetical protein VF599_23800 [Pyrinomonadaceae bacterium]|jgi:uncharacterized delta-60 repeat protein
MNTFPFARRFRFVLVAFIQVSIIVSLLAGQASAGVLDTTFGTGGKMTVDFPFSSQPNYDSYGYYTFVQPSGRIVGVGSHRQQGGKGMATGVGMLALTSTGAIDSTFVGFGRAIEWEDISSIGLSDAQMLSDGRFMRLSTIFRIFGPSPTAVLRRFNADGTTDASFSPNLSVDQSQPVTGKFAVLRDGKMLVAIQSRATNRYYLVKLNADGSRDTAFGTNGVKEIPRINPVGINDWFIGMQVLPNGKILIGGLIGFSSASLDHNELFLLRLDSSGNADHSFGALGLVRRAFGGQRIRAFDLIVQSENKYLITGAIKNPDEDAFMMRFTQRGRPDYGFGNAGMVVTDFNAGGIDGLRRGELSIDGKIIVAGYAATASDPFTSFLVARYSANGALEAHTRTAFTPAQHSVATDLAIQSDGKIVVIGYTKNPDASVNGNVFAFARYTSITND